MRTFPNASLPKVHQLMRQIPKFCESKGGKKELLQIAKNIRPGLPDEMKLNEDGTELSTDEIEHKWKVKNTQEITNRLIKAVGRHDIHKERETPLQLLEAALKKITHDDLDITAINC